MRENTTAFYIQLVALIAVAEHEVIASRQSYKTVSIEKQCKSAELKENKEDEVDLIGAVDVVTKNVLRREWSVKTVPLSRK